MDRDLTFNEYQKGTLETWTGESKFERSMLGICGEAGEVAEAYKKFLRGDYSKIEFQDKLIKELGDVLYYISVCSDELGIDLSKVANVNYTKLKSRKERNVINGNGDDR